MTLPSRMAGGASLAGEALAEAAGSAVARAVAELVAIGPASSEGGAPSPQPAHPAITTDATSAPPTKSDRASAFTGRDAIDRGLAGEASPFCALRRPAEATLAPSPSMTTRAQKRRACTVASTLAAAAPFLVASAAEARAPCQKTRIVTIFDSHGLTAFGDYIDGWALGQAHAELESYTLGGANPEWLLNGRASPRGHFFSSCEGVPRLPRARFHKETVRSPVIADLMKASKGLYDKQIVIVTLGGNTPGFPSVHTPRVEQIVRAINSQPEAVCVWIGPPSMRAWRDSFGDKVYDAIRAGIRDAGVGSNRAGPACHLIDSRRYTQYPKRGGDGWHYGWSPAGMAGAKGWAAGVIAEIDQLLAGPPPPAPPEPKPPT